MNLLQLWQLLITLKRTHRSNQSVLACPTYNNNWQLKNGDISSILDTKGTLIWKKNSQNSRPAETDPYAKLSKLTELKYAGVSEKDLVETYTLFYRSRAEYVSVAFHGLITKRQERAIERIQSTCLKVILCLEKGWNYGNALLRTVLKTLKQRREEMCLAFSLKCIKHPQLKRFFPCNENEHCLRNGDNSMLTLPSLRYRDVPFYQLCSSSTLFKTPLTTLPLFLTMFQKLQYWLRGGSLRGGVKKIDFF